MPSLNLGLLGLGAEGIYLRERFCHRHDVQFTKGWDATQAAITGVPWAADVAEVLADPHITAVINTVAPRDRFELTKRALAAGKHVLSPWPVTNTTSEVDELARLARDRQRNLLGWYPHEETSTFRGLQALSDTGKLGTFRTLTWIRRQFVPALVNLPVDDPEKWTVAEDPAFTTLPALFSQLARFVQAEPQMVASQSWEDSAGQRCGVTVDIEFSGGIQARLELDHLSWAPLETGWVLEGSRGGYVGGKWYRGSPDSELIDVLVDCPYLDQQSDTDQLLARLLESGPDEAEIAHLQRAVRLWELWNAVEA